jgi:hypothetical protein
MQLYMYEVQWLFETSSVKSVTTLSLDSAFQSNYQPDTIHHVKQWKNGENKPGECAGECQ